MQSPFKLLAVVFVSLLLGRVAKADVVTFFDFEEPGDRAGWTVSSHDSTQFRFEKVDGLFWSAAGGQDASGGLRFLEAVDWNWSETFVAPAEFVEAINIAESKRITYDLSTNADGRPAVFQDPMTQLYLFGNGRFLSTNAGPMPLVGTGYMSYEIDLLDPNREWRDVFSDPSTLVDHATVLSVVNNLVDLHIQADHPDTSQSFAVQSAWLDNVGLNVTAVPEPSCVLVVLSAAFAVVSRRRWRTIA